MGTKNVVEIKILDAETVEVTSLNEGKSKQVDLLTRSSDLSEYDESTRIICANLWSAEGASNA